MIYFSSISSLDPNVTETFFIHLYSFQKNFTVEDINCYKQTKKKKKRSVSQLRSIFKNLYFIAIYPNLFTFRNCSVTFEKSIQHARNVTTQNLCHRDIFQITLINWTRMVNVLSYFIKETRIYKRVGEDVVAYRRIDPILRAP